MSEKYWPPHNKQSHNFYWLTARLAEWLNANTMEPTCPLWRRPLHKEAFAGKSTADSRVLPKEQGKNNLHNRYVFDIWRQPNVSRVEEINKKRGDGWNSITEWVSALDRYSICKRGARCNCSPLKIYDLGRLGNKIINSLRRYFFIRILLTLQLSKSTVGAILREINFDEGAVIISSLERPRLFLRVPHWKRNILFHLGK